ncbi:MAG: F0F1 ATP synthase subunit B [Actinobacteria bacterium]|nr:F0F1 ATP synthase subunit B [Actinomycetota bacterium]
MSAVFAANPLIEVAPGLMIWTLITFGLAFAFLKWKVFGPVQAAIDARRQRIREAIEEADKARADARRLLEEHRSMMQEARGDAEQILAEARRVGESQRERMREELEADRQRRLDETSKQIESETRRALEQIRAEVAELALLATSKVTGKVLTGDDHRRLIDEAIGELDFSRLERAR